MKETARHISDIWIVHNNDETAGGDTCFFHTQI